MAEIIDIGVYLPETVLTNSELARLYPSWTSEKIFEKTGIKQRHIAAQDETAGDMGFHAAKNLFSKGAVSPSEIDFLILCTEAPDHILPATACLLQHRLGLRRDCGALDINLGCSGFVYGLSIANGLIESGAAKNVLLITSDTYSKYINSLDKSTRTIFGDAAAATCVGQSSSWNTSIGPFVFGTDGAGARNLIVEAGLFRLPKSEISRQALSDSSGNWRSRDDLYMNGPAIMSFTLAEVPKSIDKVLAAAGLRDLDIDFFVLHQANLFILNALRRKMNIPEEKFPIYIEDVGNTVSSTIPLVLNQLFTCGLKKEAKRMLLCGFGVGYSWSACIVNF